jgi:hypothetical protein
MTVKPFSNRGSRLSLLGDGMSSRDVESPRLGMDRPKSEVGCRAVRFAPNLSRGFGERAITLAEDEAETASDDAASRGPTWP